MWKIFLLVILSSVAGGLALSTGTSKRPYSRCLAGRSPLEDRTAIEGKRIYHKEQEKQKVTSLELTIKAHARDVKEQQIHTNDLKERLAET